MLSKKENKVTITIRIQPETRKKLDETKNKLGLSYGSVIDLMLRDKMYDIIFNKKDDVEDTFQKS